MKTHATPWRDTRTYARTWRNRWDASFVGVFFRRAQELNLGWSSLALGSQEVLCTAPMLVALSALMAHFHLGYVGGFLTDVLGLDAPSRAIVDSLFHSTQRPSAQTLWIGVAAATAFYLSVAGSTQRVVNAVWNHESSGLRSWRRQAAWVAVQVPGLALALFAGRYLHAAHLSVLYANLAHALTLGLAAGLFHWWGHYLFLERTVARRELAMGSLAIGVGVMILTLASPWIVPEQITTNTAEYGLIGATFVLSLWAVTYSTIVVYGTLLGHVWHARRAVGRIEVASSQ